MWGFTGWYRANFWFARGPGKRNPKRLGADKYPNFTKDERRYFWWCCP